MGLAQVRPRSSGIDIFASLEIRPPTAPQMAISLCVHFSRGDPCFLSNVLVQSCSHGILVHGLFAMTNVDFCDIYTQWCWMQGADVPNSISRLVDLD